MIGTDITAIDAAVIGAGVTGLATAVELAARGHSTCVIESRPRVGMESSTHNSGVIHAGLYYPPGTLKARLCLEGRELLYSFCARYGVPARRTGKLVVADDNNRVGELDTILTAARANGARAELLTPPQIRDLEPLLAARAALWSPDTGIVDASHLVAALAERLTDAGGILLLNTALADAEPGRDAILIATARERIRARVVVNAGGLFADEVSRAIGGEPFRVWACRGDYAEVRGPAAGTFARPIYPLPDPSGHGLGVHVTPIIGGGLMLGPTARYQASKTDYESSRPPLAFFLEAGRRLVPSLRLDDLRVGGSGIRPKLHPPDEAFADFMIRPDTRVPRLVHAAGIDSPGLTSCLAIGRLAAALAAERL